RWRLHQGHGDLSRLQPRLAHVHPHRRHGIPSADEFEMSNARKRLDLQAVSLDQAGVGGIAGEAADTVAAHLALAPVRVEHAHAQVSPVRRKDEDEPVGSDAKARVAHPAGQSGPVDGRLRLGHKIDVDVAVAQPMQLGKTHLPTPPGCSRNVPAFPPAPSTAGPALGRTRSSTRDTPGTPPGNPGKTPRTPQAVPWRARPGLHALSVSTWPGTRPAPTGAP